MTSEIERLEPERDPVLAAALREAYADAPLTPERGDVLRRRIRERALALGARHAEPATPAARPPATRTPDPLRTAWRRPVWAVPALLAATVAAILLVRGRSPRPPDAPLAPAPTAAVGFGSAEQALSADVSDAEFARVVTREDDPAALLAIAVQVPTR